MDDGKRSSNFNPPYIPVNLDPIRLPDKQVVPQSETGWCDWHDILMISNCVGLFCIALIVIIILILLIVFR